VEKNHLRDDDWLSGREGDAIMGSDRRISCVSAPLMVAIPVFSL
jgi:hypothetical protein